MASSVCHAQTPTASGADRTARDGVALADRGIARSVDLRRHGQSFELPVTAPPGALLDTAVGVAGRSM